MKYRFIVVDKGNPKKGIIPLSGLINIEDNVNEDNTEEWKKHIHEFYEDEEFETQVFTFKELKEKAEKNKKERK